MKTVVEAFVAMSLMVLVAGCRQTPPLQRDLSQQADQVVARVNDDVITRSELEMYLRVFDVSDESREMLTSLSPREREERHEREMARVLPEVVDRRVLLAYAAKKLSAQEGIEKAIDQSVEESLRKLKAGMGTVRKFHEHLANLGITVEQLRKLNKDRFFILWVEQRELGPRVYVSPFEMRRYYEENPHELSRPKHVVYRQIWVAPEEGRGEEELKLRAEWILAKVRAGALFAEMADRYSFDRKLRPGGLHVLRGLEDLVEGSWRRDLLASLRAGEFSQLHKDGIHYFTLKLEEKVEAGVPAFVEVCEETGKRMLEENRVQVRQELISELKARARIEYPTEGTGAL